MIIKNLKDLESFAKDFSSTINPYDVIILDGDLGAGKTQLTKYLCKYLDVKEDITSPTFPIVNSYTGKFLIYHFDLYRLESGEELYGIGFDDYLNQEAVIIIEWGLKFKKRMPDNSTIIQIKLSDLNTREITIKRNNIF